jgi:hypothetical protein
MGRSSDTLLRVRLGADGRPLTLKGREAWALMALIAAGARGCTPIDNPGPRWSGYVHKLRKLGIDIETVHEPHTGSFPGTHARYVLRSMLIIASEGGARNVA